MRLFFFRLAPVLGMMLLGFTPTWAYDEPPAKSDELRATEAFLRQALEQVEAEKAKTYRLESQAQVLQQQLLELRKPMFELSFAGQGIVETGTRHDVGLLKLEGPKEFIPSPSEDGWGMRFRSKSSITTTQVSLGRMYAIEFLVWIPDKPVKIGTIMNVAGSGTIFIDGNNVMDYAAVGWNLATASRPTITPNEWHHIVLQLTWDAGAQKTEATIWVDGKAFPPTYYWVPISKEIYFGQNFDGALDDIRIYDRTLSRIEIQARAERFKDLRAKL